MTSDPSSLFSGSTSPEEFAYHLNGVRHVLPGSALPADRTLLQHLRDHHGLTGAKGVCLEGACGACTVMVVRPGRATASTGDPAGNDANRPDCISVAACMTPMSTLRNCHITSIEAVAPAGAIAAAQLHPLQEAMLLTHASQCGYCTPGFVMALYAQLCKEPRSTREQLERAIDGNLCRCTGYRPILDAIGVLAADVPEAELATDALRHVRRRAQYAGDVRPGQPPGIGSPRSLPAVVPGKALCDFRRRCSRSSPRRKSAISPASRTGGAGSPS